MKNEAIYNRESFDSMIKGIQFTTLAEAKRLTHMGRLGSTESSSKIVHNHRVGVNTYVLYLAPANESGFNVCSHSTPECRKSCISHTGRAKIEDICGGSHIKNSRIKKTRLFFLNHDFFMKWLIIEIRAANEKSKRQNMFFSVRLNGCSDINWKHVYFEGKNVYQIFPEIQFYDYTKNPGLFIDKPKNLHLTFSYTGYRPNLESCKVLLSEGYNIAVVFNRKRGESLPVEFMGRSVVNGDFTDYRPADPSGCVVGLHFKESASKDNNEATRVSRFVINM